MIAKLKRLTEMFHRIKRYIIPVVIFMIVIDIISAMGVLRFAESISGFATYAVLCFMFAAFMLVLASVALSDPHGTNFADDTGFLGTVFLLAGIMLIGITMFSVSLTSWPERLTLESLWNLVWIIIGATVAFVGGKATLGLLLTGPVRTPPSIKESQ